MRGLSVSTGIHIVLMSVAGKHLCYGTCVISILHVVGSKGVGEGELVLLFVGSKLG
jgi:hypothetical protein